VTILGLVLGAVVAGVTKDSDALLAGFVGGLVLDVLAALGVKW
jgi:hypothetical protein